MFDKKREKGDVLKWLPIAMLIVALTGFADATYLTIKHYEGAIPPCSVVAGCESVLTSKYSTFFGVPVAFFGALYYVTIGTLMFLYLDSRNAKHLIRGAKGTGIGVLASGWFVYAQLGILDAICLYCMGSAITSTLLFLLGIGVFITLRKEKAMAKGE